MKTVNITELKRSFNSILSEVKQGETFVITSEGKPIAELIPAGNRRKVAIAKLEELRKTAIIGDIVSPTGEKWEAM